MDIKLKYPISIFIDRTDTQVECNTLQFARLKAKHLKALPDSIRKIIRGNTPAENIEIDLDEFLPLIAALTNQPIEVIEELDIEDLQEAVGELGNFLSISPAIGKSMSGE